MRKAMVLNIVLTIISGLSLILLATNNLHDMLGFMVLGLMAILALSPTPWVTSLMVTVAWAICLC
ncbi:hypothetical protein JCM19237_4891 [Photobacterium aphoticum]|uniref:Uncharacterized protein n=1 Tax=Photobacterium aphoticum TaxID=754436 RepID=A0A090QU65_9GAMM|nr:hypothetical protein JCM19237_4891 [Photobacterium aphoticum]